MPLVDKVVKVESSGCEMIEHMTKLYLAVKAAGGFQASAIPAEIGAIVAEMPGIVQNIGQIPGDLSENKLAFGKGVAVGIDELVEAVFAR